MTLLILIAMIKGPGVQILGGLSVIGGVWADVFLSTFIVVQDVAFRANSLFLVRILGTGDTFGSITHITFSRIWVHQQFLNSQSSFLHNFEIALGVHFDDVLADFAHVVGKLASSLSGVAGTMMLLV